MVGIIGRITASISFLSLIASASVFAGNCEPALGGNPEKRSELVDRFTALKLKVENRLEMSETLDLPMVGDKGEINTLVSEVQSLIASADKSLSTDKVITEKETQLTVLIEWQPKEDGHEWSQQTQPDPRAREILRAWPDEIWTLK